MFNKQELTIGNWIIFWILMAIPFVNIILFFILLISDETNRTQKNMLWGELILLAIALFLLLTVLSSVAIDLWDVVQRFLPF